MTNLSQMCLIYLFGLNRWSRVLTFFYSFNFIDVHCSFQNRLSPENVFNFCSRTHLVVLTVNLFYIFFYLKVSSASTLINRWSSHETQCSTRSRLTVIWQSRPILIVYRLSFQSLCEWVDQTSIAIQYLLVVIAFRFTWSVSFSLLWLCRLIRSIDRLAQNFAIVLVVSSGRKCPFISSLVAKKTLNFAWPIPEICFSPLHLFFRKILRS